MRFWLICLTFSTISINFDPNPHRKLVGRHPLSKRSIFYNGAKLSSFLKTPLLGVYVVIAAESSRKIRYAATYAHLRTLNYEVGCMRKHIRCINLARSG